MTADTPPKRKAAAAKRKPTGGASAAAARAGAVAAATAGAAAATAGTAPAEAPVVHSLATPSTSGNGVNRCERCGASEVIYNATDATFTCSFCRHEWAEAGLDAAMKLSEGIDLLSGTTVATAAVAIEETGSLVTISCTGCGAEVMIDTDANLQAHCHWCQHVLSLNNRVPNGAVPDGILPFHVTKEQAVVEIQRFVGARRSFAQPGFLAAVRPENVRGVYLPYMTVDGNCTVRLDGVGEVGRGSYSTGQNTRVYKADRFAVSREMELIVDDVIVETSESKVNIRSEISTNNIINAILPFDVKNLVRFNSNFLGGTGYTSERRDMDIDAAEQYAAQHFQTIARGWLGPRLLATYDRGVRFEAEQVWVKGSRWVSVLLPVWLMSYVENRNGVAITHYVAVNGRSGATMGSVPIKNSRAAGVAWAAAIGISIITWPMAIGIMIASF